MEGGREGGREDKDYLDGLISLCIIFWLWMYSSPHDNC